MGGEGWVEGGTTGGGVRGVRDDGGVEGRGRATGWCRVGV